MSIRLHRTRGRLSALAAFLFLAAAGCGKPEPAVVPVGGTVTVDGAPMTFGVVTFVPDAAKGNADGRAASGNLGEGGAYTLSTGSRAGAVPGWYKATVSADVPAGPPPPNPVRPNAAYASADRTKLSVEVKAGAPAGAYDLKLTR